MSDLVVNKNYGQPSKHTTKTGEVVTVLSGQPSMRQHNMMDRLNTKLEKYNRHESDNVLGVPTQKQGTSKAVSKYSGQKKKRKMNKLKKELEKFEQLQIKDHKIGDSRKNTLSNMMLRKMV